MHCTWKNAKRRLHTQLFKHYCSEEVAVESKIIYMYKTTDMRARTQAVQTQHVIYNLHVDDLTSMLTVAIASKA